MLKTQFQNVAVLAGLLFIGCSGSKKSVSEPGPQPSPDAVIVVKYLDENNHPIPELTEDRIKPELNKEITLQAKATANYYRVSSAEQKVQLNAAGERKEVVFRYESIQNEDKHPYLAMVHTPATRDINESVALKFYVSDYDHHGYSKNETTRLFDVSLTLNGNKREYANVPVGDFSLDLGRLEVGEYQYAIQAVDRSNSQKSQLLFGEFRVLDTAKEEALINSNTYRVTEADLKNYQINHAGDPATALATKNGLNRLMSDKSKAGVRKLVLLPGLYLVELEQKVSAEGIATATNVLQIPSYLTLDLNGATLKIKTTPLSQQAGVLITMEAAYDAHLINGTLAGDNREKNLENIQDGSKYGEHIQAGGIKGGSKYSSWENLTVTNFSGYAVTIGLGHSSAHAILGPACTWVPGGLTKTGELVPRRNKFTSELVDLSTQIGGGRRLTEVDTLRIGKYLGYQFSPSGREWNIDVAFYDENKHFIEYQLGSQYRELKLPQNAKYLRCSYVAVSTDELKDVSVYYLYAPKNCSIKNVTFDDNRTCGIAPFQGNSINIQGCRFIKTGRRITPVAIDLEDGWYLMQDYNFQECEVVVPDGTGDIVLVSGLNIQFRNNKNFRYTSNQLSVGIVIEDNKDLHSFTNITDRVNTGYYRIQRNAYRPESKPANGSSAPNRTLPFVVKDCTFTEAAASSGNPLDTYYRCTFDFREKTLPFDIGGMIGGNLEECTLMNYTSNRLLGIGDSVLKKCVLKNCNSLIIQGDMKLVDSKIEDFKVYNYQPTDAKILFENCDIRDFYLERVAFLSAQVTLGLSNCTIANRVRPNVVSDDFITLKADNEYLKIQTSKVNYQGNTLLVTSKLRDATNPRIDLSGMKP